VVYPPTGSVRLLLLLLLLLDTFKTHLKSARRRIAGSEMSTLSTLQWSMTPFPLNFMHMHHLDSHLQGASQLPLWFSFSGSNWYTPHVVVAGSEVGTCPLIAESSQHPAGCVPWEVSTDGRRGAVRSSRQCRVVRRHQPRAGALLQLQWHTDPLPTGQCVTTVKSLHETTQVCVHIIITRFTHGQHTASLNAVLMICLLIRYWCWHKMEWCQQSVGDWSKNEVQSVDVFISGCRHLAMQALYHFHSWNCVRSLHSTSFTAIPSPV